MQRLTLLLIPVVICIGCAPRPVFRMQPEAKNVTYDEGTGYVHRQKNGIEFTISYYRHYAKRFAMDVEIANHTDSVVRVKPGQFYYKAIGYYKGSIPGDSAQVLASIYAINPENEILQKDLAISRSVAHQKTDAILLGIGEAAILASAFNDSTQYQRDETEQNLYTNAENLHYSNRDHALDRQGLRNQRRVWERDTIRKTDLFPDDYINGYVFFRNNKKAKGYIFYYQLGDTKFHVFFSQQRFDP